MGRSLTTLISFCPLLTTYLLFVDIGVYERIPLLLLEKKCLLVIDISSFTHLPRLVNVVKERPQNLCTPWTDRRLYKFSVSTCCEKNFGMQKFSESCLYFFFDFKTLHIGSDTCALPYVLALQQLLKQLDVRQRWQARVWRGFPFLRALHQKFIVLTH